MPASELPFDVFLSHSSKDKPIVRRLAERLRGDGLKVWLDEWEIRPGDSIPHKIDAGLVRSAVLVLCMSRHSFGSDWAALEYQTFRFRDPLNRELRFIPLRLDETEPRPSLRQFAYIDWRGDGSAEAYARLLSACKRQPEGPEPTQPRRATKRQRSGTDRTEVASVVLRGHTDEVNAVAMSTDGRRAISGSVDGTLRLWDLEGNAPPRLLVESGSVILAAALSADGRRAASSSARNLFVWYLEGERPHVVLRGHSNLIWGVALSADGRRAVSGSVDMTLRVWDLGGSASPRVFEGHTGSVRAIALSADGRRAVSGSDDKTVRVWDLGGNASPRVFEGHTGSVCAIALSADGRRAVSGSEDNTLRVWDLEGNAPPRVLEGHTDGVCAVALSADGKRAVSGSHDNSVRVWDLGGNASPRVFEGHIGSVCAIALSADGRRAVSGSADNTLRVWDLSALPQQMPAEKRVRYTNAKVVLVGETNSGKTGMSVRLAHNQAPARGPSTSGHWATQWPLKGMPIEPGWDREVWLWDFGGQADQRLVHQLFLDRTAAVLLMFDASKESVLPGLREWQQALSCCVSTDVPVFLLAGRTDAGDRFDHAKVAEFARQNNYSYFETSAETNRGVPELRQALIGAIPWSRLDQHNSPARYKRMKDEVLRIRGGGKVVLATFKEIESELARRLFNEFAFTQDELRTVISLLDGPGIVKELNFGSYVLLRPEWINIYAQAVIRTLRAAESGLGYLPVRSILEGKLLFQPQQAEGQAETEKRLSPAEEQIVLQSMEATLLARRLCLRQGGDLVFPSYFGLERPDRPDSPRYFVSYTIKGFLDDIYATLVVRLAHCGIFTLKGLWRDAADFCIHRDGKKLGIRLRRLEDGRGELLAHSEGISQEEQVIFAGFIHEHLNDTSAREETSGRPEVERLRYYICPQCKEPVENRKLAMEILDRLGAKARIRCQRCDSESRDQWVPLWDEMEDLYGSEEMRKKILAMRGYESEDLGSRTKGKLLVLAVVGHILRANQKYLEVPGDQDEGIDIELEATENGSGTGKKMFLQLKAGSSHLTKLRDGTEVFRIKKQSWVRLWSRLSEVGPVMLVIGTFSDSKEPAGRPERWSFERIRWMEIGQLLHKLSDGGSRTVEQIPFHGTRLDDEEVYRWSTKVLSGDWRDS